MSKETTQRKPPARVISRCGTPIACGTEADEENI